MASLPDMRFPLDVPQLTCQVVSEAEPERQYDRDKPVQERAPKTDQNGELLWRVRLVVQSESDAEVIFVSVPGDPNVKRGELVRVEGFTIGAWERNGGYGVTFRGTAIRPVNARQGEKAAA